MVDKTKGIHALIPKADFSDIIKLTLYAAGKPIKVQVVDNQFYVPLRETLEALGYTVEWEEGSTSILLSRDDKLTRVTPNSNVYLADGQRIVCAGGAYLSGQEVAMLPVSTLSEVLKLPVNWSTTGLNVTGIVE